VEFRVLGPLEVREEKNGEPLALGGRKQRALLAILLLHPNQVVSTDRMLAAAAGTYRDLGMEAWAERAEAEVGGPG
jgi:DNA-binding response OmpR family regulator